MMMTLTSGNKSNNHNTFHFLHQFNFLNDLACFRFFKSKKSFQSIPLSTIGFLYSINESVAPFTQKFLNLKYYNFSTNGTNGIKTIKIHKYFSRVLPGPRCPQHRQWNPQNHLLVLKHLH